MCSVLRALGRLGPVDVFVIGDADPPDPPCDLGIGCVGHGPPPRRRRSTRQQLRWLVTAPDRPSDFVGVDAAPTCEKLTSWRAAEGLDYDLAWFNRPDSFLAAPAVGDALRIVDLDDREDVKLQGRLAVGVVEGAWSGPRLPGWRSLARRKIRRNIAGWRRLQLSVAADADAVVLSSAEDAEPSGLPGAMVLPNCYPQPSDRVGRVEVGAEPVFSLVGLMTYRPNADAAAWFVREVMPSIRRAAPGARVRIVGECGDAVRRLAEQPGVDVLGHVSDLTYELGRANVAVVPIRFGGGTRLKILEAWAHGIPVVATTVGAAGLRARDGEDVLLADDAASFAEACVRVLEDPTLRARLAMNGIARHADEFSCDRVEAQLASALRALLATR